MTPDIAACAGQVRQSDPDRFLATMTAPAEHRGQLFVLYAFNLEVARAPWVTKEEMIAEMRLQWWRDVVEEIYTEASVRRHEVVTPLADLIKKHDLPRSLFDDLIEARRWDIYKAPHADQQAFDDYLLGTSGALLELTARVLSANLSPALLQALNDHAYGTGIAALLCACPALESAGRFPLLDGRTEAIRTLAENALSRLASARPVLAQAPMFLRPALRCGWMAKLTLQRARTNPGRVADNTLAASPARRKFTLLIKQATGSF